MSPAEHNELVALRQEVEKLNRKMDRMDESIRGDGGDKPGINGRLSRLEAAERTVMKLIWVLVGACLTVGVPGGFGIAIQVLRSAGVI